MRLLNSFSLSNITSLVSWLGILLCVSIPQAQAQRTTTYLHTDALGSVVAATDASGTLLWRKQYHPYGEQLAGGDTSEAVSYTGHVQDYDSGLTYMGARYYDPQVGRFMSVDPVGFVESNPMSFNRYAYANDNPYRYIDPDGRAPGDPFDTDLEAHKDALEFINPKSIQENLEYGGQIYYDPASSKYYATDPVEGWADGVDPKGSPHPEDTLLVGDYHTHGDYSVLRDDGSIWKASKAEDNMGSDSYQNFDKNGIKEQAKINKNYKGSIGTPSGRFLIYDPATDKVSEL